MKIKLLLLLFLILPIAIAQEDYNNYADLTISFSFDGDFSFDSTGNPDIKEISSNLTFFPRENYMQKVQSLTFDSSPKTTPLKDENSVNFYWQEPTSLKYQYNLKSTIKNENVIFGVRKKVKFPFEAEDYTYLEPTKFIDITPEIKQKAIELAGNEDDLYVIAFKIADWLQTNIEYDLSTATSKAVQKSSWVLKNKKGVCDELTNLFISMLRSLNIPARFISGMAYTNINKDFGPHAWAEVYFPEIGWVPFDVAFNQFGWMDPTHITLKTSSDSGDSSVQFIWKSKNINFKPGNVNMKAEILSFGKNVASFADISVRPLVTKVGANSYIPLEVKIKNKGDYYVPLSVNVLKAQELTEKNTKRVLLKPHEEKKIYWITHLSPESEKGYIYTTTIEVEDNFHKKATAEITYSEDGDVISLEAAKNLIKSFSPEGESVKFDFKTAKVAKSLEIKNVMYPLETRYNDFFKIKMIIEPEMEVKNARIYLNDQEVLAIPQIINKHQFEIDAKGSDFVYAKNLDIKIVYLTKGKEETISLQKPITVTNYPWHVKLIKWLFKK